MVSLVFSRLDISYYGGVDNEGFLHSESAVLKIGANSELIPSLVRFRLRYLDRMLGNGENDGKVIEIRCVWRKSCFCVNLCEAVYLS